MENRMDVDLPHEPMLSVTEAAGMLRCHPNTIRAWMRQGKLEPVRMGVEKVPMLRKAEVEALRKPLEHAGVIVKDDKHAFPVVGIGASAGGLDAMTRLLQHLPTDLGLAYVLVSHVDKGHEDTLCEVLRKKTALPVFLMENGMALQPDRLYICPAATHAAVVNGTFTLRTPGPGTQLSHRPIDAFFTALANEYQNNAIGIVLSGTGADGTEGLRAIHAEDGLTLAQDTSALEQGMPQNAQDADVVDLVRGAEEIGKELADIVKRLYPGGYARIPGKHENELRRILAFLHQQRGIDFSAYKEATIHRRIIRRMVLSKCRKLSDYSALLHGLPSEVDKLCNDLLINVTSFFRDPLFHRALEQVVLPQLFAQRVQNDPVRIWVPACAGGEEVVSIAITLLEFLGDSAMTTPVQIFSTDLNERTIEKARLGIYSKSALQNVDPERVRRFFTHVDGHFQVIKTIRDMCVFAKHDLLKDPPFSRVDLVSCQNVLIYLENPAQARVLRSFHYALKPGGFLALGKSETVSVAGDIFQQPEREHKVYTKRHDSADRVTLDVRYTPSVLSSSLPFKTAAPPPSTGAPSDLDRETEKVLLHRFVPPSVVVNEHLDIVRFRGATTQFLAPSTGKASLGLLKMVRDDLAFELRGLLQKVRKGRTALRKGSIPVRMHDDVHHVALEVVPVGDSRDPHYLVLFTDEGPVATRSNAPPHGRKVKDLRDERERRILQLEQELQDAREQMRLSAEEAEAHNQDLQSANEEVVSSNEELQSINEELETSKEELQSINEEFATINEELQARNDALLESEERYRKLIDLMPVAVYTCDPSGHVRLFNEAAVRLWGRVPVAGETLWCGSTSRRTADGAELPLEQCPMALAIKEERAMADIESVVVRPDGEQRTVLANPTPLYDTHGRMSGAINVLVDITERTEGARRLDLATKVGNLGIWDWDITGDTITWTDAVYPIHGVEKRSFTPTMAGYRELIHPDDRDRVGAAIRATLEKNAPYAIEFRTLNPQGKVNWVYTNAVVIRAGGHPVRMLGGTMNITERKSAESALRESEERFKAIYRHASFGIILTDPEGRVVDANPAYATMVGWNREEIIGRTSVELGISSDARKRQRTIDGILSSGSARDVEMELRRQDGSSLLVRTNSDTVMMGEHRFIISIVEDITERKRDEQRMVDLSARLSLALDSAELGTWNIDGKVEHMTVDERFKTIFGWSGDTVTVEQAFSVLHPEDLEHTRAAIEGATRPVDPLPYEVEYRVVHPDGSIHWVLAKGRSNFTEGENGPELASFDGTVVDITERKQAEEAQRILASIVESSNDAILSRDLHGVINSWNKSAERMFGYAPEEIIGQSSHLLYPEDRAEEEERLLRKVRNGERAEHFETVRIHKDGTPVQVALTLSPLKNSEGEIVGASKVIRDITESNKAREEIRLSEERFHLLADNVVQLIWMAEADGSAMWFNKRWFEFTGMSAEQIRMDAKSLHHPEHYERVTASLKARAEKGEQWEEQFPLKSKDGKFHWFLATAMPVRARDGKVVRWFGTLTDITKESEDKELIRQSEERYRGLFTNMDQGFCVIEMIHDGQGRPIDYRYLEMNRAFERHTGMVNAIGRTMRELVPDLEQHWFDTYGEVARTGESISFEQRAEAMQGRWFEVYAYRVDANTRRVAVLFSDVSERKKAAEELRAGEERFRLLADNIGQLAWIAEPDGDINWYNKRWFDYSGTTLQEMRGWGWQNIQHPDHVVRVTEKFKEHLQAETDWEDTFPIRGADGEYHWFLSRAFPVRNAEGKVVRWFGTNTDITEQKLAEEALEESAKHKDHFLATLAHELRNPLAPLKNGLQLMELVPDDPGMLETTRAMMVRQLDHMVRLVDDLMDLSRISRGKIALLKAPVELSSVVATAIEASKPLIERNTHQLHVDMGAEALTVDGDAARLTQVVANLLNNAAKYTPPGGRIDLSLSREDDLAVIRVKDTGIGIAASDIPHVFDMFAQVDTSPKAQSGGGLGIGLNIVRRLVELHGGRVEAISHGSGQGSEFTVSVPLMHTPDRAAQPVPLVHKAGRIATRRVLVVDDNQDAALTMSMVIGHRGHVVAVAHDGLEAIERLVDFRPDLVFMDIGMPRLNGYEACARMRQLAEGKEITIVALSGWGQEEDRRRSEEAGFDRHIVKPVDRATLERVIAGSGPSAAE